MVILLAGLVVCGSGGDDDGDIDLEVNAVDLGKKDNLNIGLKV